MVSLPAGGQQSASEEVASNEEMPLPTDLRLLVQLCILALLGFYALYLVREVFRPVTLAFGLNLLLQPGMRLLSKIYIPRAIAALLLIITVFGAAWGVGYSISGPAASWIAKAPESLPRLEERLRILKRPLGESQKATKQVEQITQGGGESGSTLVAVLGSGLTGVLFSGVQAVLSGLVLTVLTLFFLLVAGDIFLRRLVEILPRFRDKKQAVEIAHEIEDNVSIYLVTVSLMNLAVGVATALVMWAIGVPDPVLWGALAFVLNYVPILGPLTGIVVFIGVGMLTFDSIWLALLPATLYFGIHLVEGETVTPMLLARRFTLNPVLVVLSLVFWNWMWGVPGALMAVPMLAVVKIVCDRWPRWVTFSAPELYRCRGGTRFGKSAALSSRGG